MLVWLYSLFTSRVIWTKVQNLIMNQGFSAKQERGVLVMPMMCWAYVNQQDKISPLTCSNYCWSEVISNLRIYFCFQSWEGKGNPIGSSSTMSMSKMLLKSLLKVFTKVLQHADIKFSLKELSYQEALLKFKSYDTIKRFLSSRERSPC